MKEKLLLIGAGEFGRVVLEHVRAQYDCAFLDDNLKNSVDGIPVIGTTGRIERLYGDYKKLVVTIGNNSLRERLYNRAETAGFEFPNVIVPSAYISPHAKLGKGIVVLNNAVIQNNASIGDGTIINPGVEVRQDSTIGKYCLVYSNSVIRSLSYVGDRAWIGSTVTVSTGVTVGEDAIVEDGSTVKREMAE